VHDSPRRALDARGLRLWIEFDLSARAEPPHEALNRCGHKICVPKVGPSVRSGLPG
jgi:hypothetical protein